MTPVIFDGNEGDIGKIVKIKITSSNKNTLFEIYLQNQN